MRYPEARDELRRVLAGLAPELGTLAEQYQGRDYSGSNNVVTTE